MALRIGGPLWLRRSHEEGEANSMSEQENLARRSQSERPRSCAETSSDGRIEKITFEQGDTSNPRAAFEYCNFGKFPPVRAIISVVAFVDRKRV